jgi:tetratricopeptide (TPR) repeat protein
MNAKKAIFLIFCIGLIVYANCFSNKFVWDDQFLIIENDYIKSWQYLPQMLSSELRFFSPNLSNYYRPLQSLSYAIDYQFWRLDVFGYHLNNLFLHLACTWLVYLVVTLFGNNWVALFSSLLFLVHPLNTQVVTYISGRADSLVTVFSLASFYLFGQFFRQEKRRMALYIFSLFFYILALLSKEISIVLPFILLIYILSFKYKIKYSSFLYCLPYFIFSTVYLFLRLSMLHFTKDSKTLFFWQDIPFYIRLFGLGKVVLEYLKILMFPIDLHLDHSIVYPQQFFSVTMLISVFILVLILFLFWFSFRYSRVNFFFLSWFFISLFPTANIIFPLGVSVSPHWLYFPAIGIFAIFSTYLVRLVINKKRREKILLINVMGLILLIFGFATYNHNFKWRDNLTLYLHELKYSPDDSVLHNNLGNEYRKRGLYLQAEQEFQRSIALTPKYPLGYNNLGLVYLEQGIIEKAINNFQKAISLSPGLYQAYINLGRAHQKRGQIDLAQANFQQAINVRFQQPLAYYHLGMLYSEQGKKELAIRFYLRAIEVNPLYVPAFYNLGFIFKQQGDLQQAQYYWQRALEIAPSDKFVRQALQALLAESKDGN